jgi:hypothetical protein
MRLLTYLLTYLLTHRFRKYFPLFMKFITGGYVGEEEAGMRLFQVHKS